MTATSRDGGGSVLDRLQPLPGFRNIRAGYVLLACYAALNLGLAAYFVRIGPDAGDWQLWLTIPEKLARGELYEPPLGPFVWSPVAAWLLVGVVQLGYWAWFALHLAVVPLLRDRWLIAFTLASWPFWHDAAEGNTFAFVFVSGALALRGSRAAAIIYLSLLLLMPRPVQVPLAAWLLWRMPDLRLPFAALFMAHAAAVLASGYALDWFDAVRSYGSAGAMENTIGPPRWLGAAWLAVGIPLGAWLWWRGRLGLAGIAISPYWLPGYLLMWLLELVPRGAPTTAPQQRHRAEHDQPTVAVDVGDQGGADGHGPGTVRPGSP
jgi:hypothetical protein